MSLGHFLKWKNFLYISGVIQQYLGPCTFTQEGNLHKLPKRKSLYPSPCLVAEGTEEGFHPYRAYIQMHQSVATLSAKYDQH